MRLPTSVSTTDAAAHAVRGERAGEAAPTRRAARRTSTRCRVPSAASVISARSSRGRAASDVADEVGHGYRYWPVPCGCSSSSSPPPPNVPGAEDLPARADDDLPAAAGPAAARAGASAPAAGARPSAGRTARSGCRGTAPRASRPAGPARSAARPRTARPGRTAGSAGRARRAAPATGPSSSSWIDVSWISRSRWRPASSSGAARTSSSSCLIIVPIRITLAGCSTMPVISSESSLSSDDQLRHRRSGDNLGSRRHGSVIVSCVGRGSGGGWCDSSLTPPV